MHILKVISGQTCLFEFSDWKKIQGLTLYVGSRGYVMTSQYDPTIQQSTPRPISRIILGITDPKVKVNHINNNKLDFRRENLRKCTTNQIMATRGLQGNNKTGRKGVVARPRSDGSVAYCVFVKKDGKSKGFGTYDSLEDAAKVYDREALLEWGDFAQLNYPNIDSSNFYPEPSNKYYNPRKKKIETWKAKS